MTDLPAFLPLLRLLKRLLRIKLRLWELTARERGGWAVEAVVFGVLALFMVALGLGLGLAGAVMALIAAGFSAAAALGLMAGAAAVLALVFWLLARARAAQVLRHRPPKL
ncbi:hypothetical protein LPB142_07300 [Rhodobacter xanthinilyticus]|uniref:Uncharacterized protein n=1 Tax=Rhodobacter xanthinilyticus TaxID=1850250 RepID=A0A1D9MBE6_9RHOB|nr:hypothetical protein [Rhodobacter xanthinilyticus]AOZ69153.1 hypothetical protein LPB142_07300 [Rhodobacter xanthinilyticus]